jgi:cyclic-di-GMP phosphodiesterase TipF (flagellum assembly factor)
VLREAVAADRLEFYLQPILALPQRKPRYYEALARLRTSDGELTRRPISCPWLRPAGSCRG